MGKIPRAVFDAGPFIHLHEIDLLRVLSLFKSLIITKEVFEELTKRNLDRALLQKHAKILVLDAAHKNKAMYFADRYSLDLGEASSLALGLQEHVSLFITDDLDARTIAKSSGLEVHGSIGVILRAFRETILTRQSAQQKIKELHTKSSLFVTSALVDFALRELESYPDKRKKK